MLPEVPTSADLDSFVRAALRSGLLGREELEAALRSLPAHQRDDPRTVADHLVQQGKLSRFQAHKILKGAPVGLVIGPYHLIAPLGKGGMGAVYLARDTRSGKMLALKVLPPKKALAEERLLVRFRREMAISQRVAHPHLARTYEAGAHEGVYFIAMEYIPGKTLYRVVSENGPLEVQRAARLFVEVAAGLAHAHQLGVIHRDLKPSNIMVTPNDHAKVLDLGLALVRGEEVGEDSITDREVIGGQGYVVGSMDYIAPEQTQDAVKIDARADIYGLGCVLFFALTGQPPFPGGTSKQKMRRHRKEEPPEVIQLNPRVPLGFALIVKRMMAKNPDDRFPTMTVVRQVLLEWTNGEPALPLEQPDDAWYQQAIDALKRAQFATDGLTAEIVTRPALPHTDRPGWLGRLWGSVRRIVDGLRHGESEYLPLVLGIVGFWVVLLGVLGLVLLLR